MIIAAFLAVYLIWGSTYLAIRVVVQSLPPFAAAGMRFLIGGCLMYAYARLRGAPRPKPKEWKSTLIAGGLMLGVANGLVNWAESRVDSGMTAVILASVTLWMVLFDALFGSRRTPSRSVLLGTGIGMAGLWILTRPDLAISGGQGVNLGGLVALMVSTLFWAIGSIYIRGAIIPKSAIMTNAMEMLGGFLVVVVLSFLNHEWHGANFSHVRLVSVLALGYLIVFGSMIGFSAYSYLLHHTTPERVSTYAYVNPVIALFLGWLILGEKVEPRTGIASAVIVTGVVLIIRGRAEGRRRKAKINEKAQSAKLDAQAL